MEQDKTLDIILISERLSMKNKLLNSLRKKSNIKERFKEKLIEYMNEEADKGNDRVKVLLPDYIADNEGIVRDGIQIKQGLTFIDIKNMFPDDNFKFMEFQSVLVISWE